MRNFTFFRIAAIPLFRSPAVLRCYRSRTQDFQRFIIFGRLASLSILASAIWCPAAAIGEDFIETGLVPTTDVTNVPGKCPKTLRENSRGFNVSVPHQTGECSSVGNQTPQIEYAPEDASKDPYSPDDSNSFGEFSQVPTAEILMPMTSAPVMLLPKTFVHERRTVRMSERTAEIWVKLPKDSQSSVSVNFVEHPPEGDFRIFRTRINTFELRRFYLSAKRWDVHANHWIDLVAMPSLSSDETPDLGYLDLGPGQRRVVTFTDCHPPERCVDVP